MYRPLKLSLKRRLDETPPDTLILESSSERPAKKIQYVREDLGDYEPRNERSTSSLSELPATNGGYGKADIARKRRTFHLKQSLSQGNGKRRKQEHDVPTFEEIGARENTAAVANAAVDRMRIDDERRPSSPLKRPGKSATIRRPSPNPPPETSASDQQHLQEFADYIQQMEEEELRWQSAPAQTVTSPAIPRQRRNANLSNRNKGTSGQPHTNANHALNDDGFVYDTYVLAPSAAVGAMQVEAQLDSSDNVGYLVIAEEDESVWAAYADFDGSDAEAFSDGDDADENAEDFYGADYPEDELASDDEFDRNAYSYRNNGDSDGEEWDAMYSDDQQDQVMNSFRNRSVGRFANHLYPGHDFEDGDDTGEASYTVRHNI